MIEYFAAADCCCNNNINNNRHGEHLNACAMAQLTSQSLRIAPPTVNNAREEYTVSTKVRLHTLLAAGRCGAHATLALWVQAFISLREAGHSPVLPPSSIVHGVCVGGCSPQQRSHCHCLEPPSSSDVS